MVVKKENQKIADFLYYQVEMVRAMTLPFFGSTKGVKNIDKAEIGSKNQVIITREVIMALPELYQMIAEIAEKKGLIEVK